MTAYDLIVIGGGIAGQTAAVSAAALGARVAVVERDRWGGEHLWTGEVPTLALRQIARQARQARAARRFETAATSTGIDFGAVLHAVRERQRRFEPRLGPERLRALGIDAIEGAARFEGATAVAVETRVLQAPRVLVATGAAPALPAIDGITAVPWLTHERLFDLQRLPDTMVVVGAGSDALELAHAFALLGVRVHVVHGSSALLPHEDAELTDLLAAQLAADGVTLHVGAQAVAVAGSEERMYLTVRESTGAAATVAAGALAVMAERVPRVVDLALDAAGIEVGPDGTIVVDARLRTTAEGVWAAGGVIGGPRFVSIAEYEARLAVHNAFFPNRRRCDRSRVPWAIGTDPELARVGLTEVEARARHGGGVRVWRQPVADVDRAVIDGGAAGLVKLVATRRGRILGAHIFGPRAAEIVGVAALAMREGIGLNDLARLVPPFATYAEALRATAEQHVRARRGALIRSVAQRWVRGGG